MLGSDPPSKCEKRIAPFRISTTRGSQCDIDFVCMSWSLARPALFIAALLCLPTAAAHANGRLPGATGLAFHPTDEKQLLLSLTYGLALSRDGGANWSWLCEQQIDGNGGDIDPAAVMTSDGTLVVLALTNGGMLVSRDDGCTFERPVGPLQRIRGVDLTL